MKEIEAILYRDYISRGFTEDYARNSVAECMAAIPVRVRIAIEQYGNNRYNEALDKAAGMITMESTSPKRLHEKIIYLKLPE